MNITLWIIASVLALAFLAAGGMKVTRSRDKLASSGLGWAQDFSAGAVKGIGAAEILGALGLILPAITGIATVLVPIAASGLVIVMIGAGITHARRGEYAGIAPSAVLGVLALVVAIGRFAGVGY